ncbi:hypothetical protein CASFOL_021028 [Castilleja foliolosa]|uniref:SAM domain-containing protein n=1 Tax=Castilleja foliolosa TaxID=1961234 RepID=A0ABD3D4M0_9LAMI
MAAQLDPSETPISTAIPSSDPPPLDRPSASANPPKRQRRPSVRLGEIGGDSHYESQNRRPSKTWRFHKDPSFAAKTSKTRPLTNLVNGVDDPIGDFTHRSKPKSNNKQPTKRVRTNWNKPETAAISNGAGMVMNEEQNENSNENEEEEEEEEEGEEEEGFREVEGSESPKQSPINSLGLQFWDQRRVRSRTHVSESNGPEPVQNDVGSVGVREWLTGLGLGRYTALFEIHEVDDEVLPLLTLEDLKDMGVNAVGSRRKMYNAILKLRKGFS